MLNITKTTIEIGLDQPFKVLHVTDNHIPLCDERDNARKQEIAARKAENCAQMVEYLCEEVAHAEENCDLLVHSGDLMDFISHANLDFARKMLRKDKVLFIAGNHDYSQYVGEAWEDQSYRMNSVMSMGAEGLGVNMFFTSRIVGGINFVGIDDAYHQVEDWQTERLRMEVKKGYPVVLFMHVPLFEQSLYEKSIAFWNDTSAYVAGCDEEHLLTYSEFRAAEQRPAESTKRFVDYVNGETQIKAVLAGHLHFEHESRLPGGTMQYVTNRGDSGYAREITFI